MLTTFTAPAFAKTWYIENGDITVKAGEAEGPNKVKQGDSDFVKDEGDTIITGTSDKNTVTIEAENKNDTVEVTLKDVNIDASSRNEAAVSVTGSGNTTIKLDGDNHLTGGISDNGSYGLSGISSSGSLTISGGETDSLTAQGGSGENGGDGIFSFGRVAISGGTVNATGGVGSSRNGGSGIYSSNSSVTISGGTVNAAGGNGNFSGGCGIYNSGSLIISDGTVNATGGNGKDGYGGYGISSSDVAISGGTVNANGGDSKDGYGGNGISSSSGVAISDGTVNANGGDSKNGSGGSGIFSFDRVAAISGGTVNANGGNGGSGDGGDGIRSFAPVAISGGAVTANGGSGNSSGGNGIYSRNDIDLSGSLELTAKAGSPNGKALSQNGNELELDTIKDKLGPGAKVTATDADGKVNQVPIPRPVEPEESSSSSGGGSSAPSAPASPLPGLTVTDKSGQRISYTSTQSGNTLTVCVGRFTASFRISLATLRQLRAEGIETITFQTILCSTTLSVDELLAMGGEDAEAVLTHRLTDSSLTVG